jgi:hypothetical protein
VLVLVLVVVVAVAVTTPNNAFAFLAPLLFKTPTCSLHESNILILGGVT